MCGDVARVNRKQIVAVRVGLLIFVHREQVVPTGLPSVSNKQGG